jgi:hypothetical protein
MKCMNCLEEVPEDKGCLTIQTFLCQPCDVLVVGIRSRMRSEIEGMLARVDAGLRHALTQGHLTDKILHLERDRFLEYTVVVDTSASEEACRNTSKTIPSTESS